MLTEPQQKFLEALRSDEFTQTTNRLKDRVTGGMCCLGVACEVYRRETGRGRWIAFGLYGADSFMVEGETAINFMPSYVASWLGLREHEARKDPAIGRQPGGVVIYASYANDELDWNFSKIADGFQELFERVNREASQIAGTSSSTPEI